MFASRVKSRWNSLPSPQARIVHSQLFTRDAAFPVPLFEKAPWVHPRLREWDTSNIWDDSQLEVRNRIQGLKAQEKGASGDSFTFRDFPGNDGQIGRIKCYGIAAGKGEGTQKPRSVAHPMATALDFHGVIQTTPKRVGMNGAGKPGAG